MGRISSLHILGLVAVLLSPASGRALSTVEMPPEGESVALSDALEVVEDPTGLLSAEEVAAGARPAWPPTSRRELIPGYTSSTFWVHFRLRNSGPTAGEWRLELWRDIYVAELHARTSDGARTVRRTGKAVPVSQRDVPARELLLRIPLAAQTSVDCWLRLSGGGSLMLTPVLWSQAALSHQATSTGLLWGMYYGALLAMLAYNLFLYLSTRDGVYLSYFLFQMAITLMSAAGDQLLFYYLWPERPEWATHSELILVGLTLVGGLEFSRRFLSLESYAPSADRGILALAVLAALFTAAALVTTAPAFQQALALLAAVVAATILAAGLWAIRAGGADAGVFCLAWLALLMGGAVSALTLMGLLPATAPTTDVRLGSAVEAILLSLSLGRRIKLLRAENERTRTEFLESRLAYARTLETHVEERTRELSVTLDELRAAQARMVQQARLASLGHLVAGVAHEVGNPLNFTIGGTEDLTRRLRTVRDDLSALPPGAALERVNRQLGNAERALALVQEGNTRIRKIVENLRGYVRSSSNALEQVNLNTELETTLKLLQPQLERSGIRVECDLQPLPPLACRPGELGQVFMNLALNSCQAMPEGGDICISSRATAEQIELSFQDTGPGVPPEHRDAIFDPFFTTRPPNEGTGLGLSISHEIVARHGGELRLVDSAAGARFVITLPFPASARAGDVPRS